MKFSACIIIPLYNHGSTLYQTITQIEPYELPVIVIDDGSDQDTQQAVQRVINQFPWVRSVRLEKNSGKGAAVMRGFSEAYQEGYTHALQIDADGQHQFADIPKFLQAAQRYPQALVCGQPIYDASAPASRLYGRKLTQFWVWIETLSFAIRDAMCGFRFYPITAALQASRHTAAQRMAFDIEIAVRMYWSGLPVINIPTQVIYPEQGISHFHLWRDNWQISCTHTRLVIGMLLRLPLLLWRKLFGPRQRREYSCG